MTAPQLRDTTTGELVTILAPAVGGRVMIQRDGSGLLDMIDADLLSITASPTSDRPTSDRPTS